jgi:C-terminal processing protease CtpA/Prc
MGFVAHTDAIIFDIRQNGGGQPAMVTLIASYLFDRPTHLIDIYDRKENSTTQNWTLSYLPGPRLTKQPVFVLTSKRTFSGAEEFAFDLKNQKRATIVGETTGGGAHPVSGHMVADYFMVGVPSAKSLDPVTRTNWEGTGVEPDVKVPAADALATAEKLAMEKIQAKKDGK